MSEQAWIAYSQDQHILAQLTALAKEDGLSEASVFSGSCLDALAQIDQHIPCLLVSVQSPDLVEHDLTMLATQCHKFSVKLLVLGRENQILSFSQLKQIGVTNYLPAPFQVEDIRRIIQEAISEEASEKKEEYLTQVYTVVGVYPGVGVSTLSANAAALMATQQETLWIDCDPLGGSGWRHFSEKMGSGLVELLSDTSRLDRPLYESTRHLLADNLYGLGDQQSLTTPAHLEGDALQHCLSFLYGKVPVIILDVPYHQSHLIPYLLPYSSFLVLVMDQTQRSIKHWPRLLPLFEEVIPMTQWKVWFNESYRISDSVDMEAFEEELVEANVVHFPYLGEDLHTLIAEEHVPFVYDRPRHRFTRLMASQLGLNAARFNLSWMPSWLRRTHVYPSD
tara:strand:+ start:421 stop:1599 length:1179 start_codon:yes stop_codon:yes gene_type:complete